MTGTGILPDDALRIGQRLARATFEKRGNHSEAHIGESELALLLAIAAAAGRGRLRDKVAALRETAQNAAENDTYNHVPMHEAGVVAYDAVLELLVDD